jgi:hypothetical protein
MKKLIQDFLDKFGTKVLEGESLAHVEFMMDDHICIEWEDDEYYVPKNNSSYTEEDDLIFEFLNECRHV